MANLRHFQQSDDDSEVNTRLIFEDFLNDFNKLFYFIVR